MFERKEINKILNKMGFLKWSQELNKITPDKYQKYQAQLEELINDLLDNTLEDFIQYKDYDDIFTNDIMTYFEVIDIQKRTNEILQKKYLLIEYLENYY